MRILILSVIFILSCSTMTKKSTDVSEHKEIFSYLENLSKEKSPTIPYFFFIALSSTDFEIKRKAIVFLDGWLKENKGFIAGFNSSSSSEKITNNIISNIMKGKNLTLGDFRNDKPPFIDYLGIHKIIQQLAKEEEMEKVKNELNNLLLTITLIGDYTTSDNRAIGAEKKLSEMDDIKKKVESIISGSNKKLSEALDEIEKLKKINGVFFYQKEALEKRIGDLESLNKHGKNIELIAKSMIKFSKDHITDWKQAVEEAHTQLSVLKRSLDKTSLEKLEECLNKLRSDQQQYDVFMREMERLIDDEQNSIKAIEARTQKPMLLYVPLGPGNLEYGLERAGEKKLPVNEMQLVICNLSPIDFQNESVDIDFCVFNLIGEAPRDRSDIDDTGKKQVYMFFQNDIRIEIKAGMFTFDGSIKEIENTKTTETANISSAIKNIEETKVIKRKDFSSPENWKCISLKVSFLKSWHKIAIRIRNDSKNQKKIKTYVDGELKNSSSEEEILKPLISEKMNNTDKG